MGQAKHNKLAIFIWGVAGEVLRNRFKFRNHPDFILSMCVIRLMDVIMKLTKKQILASKQMLDKTRIIENRESLCASLDQTYFGTSVLIQH